MGPASSAANRLMKKAHLRRRLTSEGGTPPFRTSPRACAGEARARRDTVVGRTLAGTESRRRRAWSYTPVPSSLGPRLARHLTRESVIKTKREAIRRFIKAMTEAIAFIKQERESTMQIIGKYLKVEDREALRRTWEEYKEVYPMVPMPTPEGVATALAEEAKKRPEAAKAAPAAFVDQSFVKELEASGFIAALYRR